MANIANTPASYLSSFFFLFTGKRACPGESLATMELFILFTNLLQNFTFELTADPKEIDLANLFMRCRDNGKHRYIRAIRRKI